MALCEGANHDPALLAAASYCEDYDAGEIAAAVAAVESKWITWPNSRAARAAALSAERAGVQSAAVAEEIEKTWYAHAVAWHLAASEHLSSETALKLHEAPASMLAWQFARHGYDKNVEDWLIRWLKRPGALRFLALVALMVRRPVYHQLIGGVAKLASNDPVMSQYARALTGAIQAGPYTSESALSDAEALFGGSREQRLQRAMRLATFVPGCTPLVDPDLPFAWQERSAVRLAAMLKEAVASGASFAPDAYANKKISAQSTPAQTS